MEYEDSDLADGFGDTSRHRCGFTTIPEAANTDNWYLNVAQSLEARYTGFRDWSLYANAEVSEDWGNEAWDSTPILDQVNLNQDWERLGFKYTLGANWYPLPQLNFGGQYYHEIHDYTYTNRLNSSLIQYPGYLRKQNFTTDDVNIRATWQALSNVSLVTRYDFQFSTVDTWSIPNGGTQVGGRREREPHQPHHRRGCQLDAAALPLPAGRRQLCAQHTGDAGGRLGRHQQPASSTARTIIGRSMPASATRSTTRPIFSCSTPTTTRTITAITRPPACPTAPATQENSFTATLTRQISKTVKVSLKYGFYRNRDETSGGQNNYDAQLVYLSTQFGF